MDALLKTWRIEIKYLYRGAIAQRLERVYVLDLWSGSQVQIPPGDVFSEYEKNHFQELDGELS